jgi:hypothetical protein
MKAGDTVRFVEVREPGDEEARFTVLDGYEGSDRVAIKAICTDLPFPPVNIVLKSEVEVCQ